VFEHLFEKSSLSAISFEFGRFEGGFVGKKSLQFQAFLVYSEHEVGESGAE